MLHLKAIQYSSKWVFKNTHAGERDIKKVLRKTLFNYKLHQDQDLFDKAFNYIREYY